MNRLTPIVKQFEESASRITALSSRGEPWAFKAVETKLDAVIGAAARLQKWEILEEAMDAKIEDQAEFVRWWDENVRRAGGDTRSPKTINPERALMNREDAEGQTGVRQQQVSRWRKLHRDVPKYRERMIIAAYRKADIIPPENHRAEGTGENQWFTPEQYIVAARLVMGSIDLDPATHVAAQQVVQATEFYTQQDDGLTKEWHGAVWLNPPYSQPEIGQFVDKLVEEYAAGRTDQAILLTHNYTDTTWFHTAEKQASLICFTRGRIKFVDIDGETCAPTQGQAFFYFGSATEEFRTIFGKFGFVR